MLLIFLNQPKVLAGTPSVYSRPSISALMASPVRFASSVPLLLSLEMQASGFVVSCVFAFRSIAVESPMPMRNRRSKCPFPQPEAFDESDADISVLAIPLHDRKLQDIPGKVLVQLTVFGLHPDIRFPVDDLIPDHFNDAADGFILRAGNPEIRC